MIKVDRRIASIVLLVALAIVVSAVVKGCEYFPESSFELASDSRLPLWFALGSGLTRADVSVTMNYYSMPWGKDATFILYDRKKHVLAKIDGNLEGLAPLHLKGISPSGANDYPSFEIITAKGVTEVIEHKKMEPTFYIVDRPADGTHFESAKS